MLDTNHRRSPSSSTASILVVGVLAASLSGCGSILYAKTPQGKFAGKLDVEWVAPNQFVYRPDASDPLVYVTASGQRIEPKLMYTDAGSIPRLFWSTPNLGPWDFAPGYIIHDWLFQQHHCQLDDWAQYDFQRSAEILAEAIKTQMERASRPNPEIVFAIYQAVRTSIAEELWDSGECKTPPAGANATSAADDRKRIRILTINAN